MRGTPDLIDGLWATERFIPAYAGNTADRQRQFRLLTVHPRVCGEHPVDGGQPLFDNGSSPRMRGTQERLHLCPVARRFIPAYAGNTLPYGGRSLVRTVHPRVCGEHHDGLADLLAPHGSSPRMRGTLFRTQCSKCDMRFIPAYAGNTSAVTASSFRIAVHPRVCGEHM